MKRINLFIFIPSTESWEAKFGMSLVFMTNYLASKPFPGVNEVAYTVWNKKGSLLANMRQAGIEEALRRGATHMLCLDSDQTFPRDLAHRLYGHHKHVVACNIATKGLESYPTARNYDKNGDPLEVVYTLPESKGLEAVARIGTGIMMLDMNLFKREGMKEGPWFDTHWSERTKAYIGEDWALCERLEAAGVKIYIDHDLSKDIGHVGRYEYTLSDTWLTREYSNGTICGNEEESLPETRNVGAAF